MKRYYRFLLILLLFISIFGGIKQVYAEPTFQGSNYTINLLDNNSDQVCDSLLGPAFKKDLEQIFKIMLVAGPLIVVVLTSVEFISAIASKDDDAIKKCTAKLTTRLILVAVLFFLPILLNLLLSFLDEKYTTCINVS